MSKALRNFKLWRGLAAVTGVLLSVAIFLSALLFQWAGNVNIFLGAEVPTVEASGDTLYYDIGYEMSAAGLTQMLADSDAHDVQTMEEGSVLLKNDNNALPLAAPERGSRRRVRAARYAVRQSGCGSVLQGTFGRCEPRSRATCFAIFGARGGGLCNKRYAVRCV